MSVHEPEGGHNPLLGRDHEVRVLQRAVDDARRRRTQLIEIVGEAGIGKTRLVEELPRLAPHFYSYAAVCERYRTSEAYFPVRSLLRTVAGIPQAADRADAGALLERWVGEVTPELKPLLPLLELPFGAETGSEGQPGGRDPARRRELMHGGVDALLTRTLQMPTLLVFEDAQWMDDASRSLLVDLARSPIAKPWLICVTRRPDGEPIAIDVSRTVIALQPLTPPAAKALALQGTGPALHPHALEQIIARSGGNPFFVRELVAAVHIGGAALPASVEAVLRERLSALEDDDRLVLAHASVIGRSFDLELLRQTLYDTELDADLDRRIADLAGFVEEVHPDRFHFRHDLLQEAAYADLGPDRRSEVHGRVAEALEERAANAVGELAAELALHFGEAANWDKTWHYAVVAGRRAQVQYANRVAVGLYERALSAAEHIDAHQSDVAQVVEALGDTYALIGEFDPAQASFERAEALAGGDDLSRARIRRKRGQCCIRLSLYDQAWSWFERAFTLVPDPPTSSDEAGELMEVELGLAGVAFYQGRFDVAASWSRRAMERAEQAASDPQSLAHAYYLLESTQDYLGGDRSTRYRLRALAIYQELGDVAGEATVTNNLGTCAYFDARWNEALRFYRRATALNRRIGNIALLGGNLNNEAEILSDQGRFDDASAILEEARTVYEAAGSILGTAVATSNLARVAARAGRPSDAEPLLRDALAAFEEIGAESFAVEARARLAEAFVFAGEHRRAYELAARTLETTQGTPSPGVTAMLERIAGYAAFQNFEPDVAADHFRRSLEAAREDDALYESALTLIAAAELAERSGLEEPAILRAEGQEILDRLGVVALPSIPLPETFFEPHEHRL